MNGIDVTNYCDLETLKIQEDILNNTWQLDVDVRIQNQQIRRPLSNTEVKVINGSSYEFAGVIATVTEKQIDPYTFIYSVTAGGYSLWFDRHLVDEFYPQQNADSIVKSIVNAFCPGFTTNHVQPAPVVAAQNLDYKEPSAAIKDIANLLAWNFYIDYTKDVHFYLAESIPSPLPGNTLNADTDLVSFGDLELEEDGSQVKNRIIAKEFKVMSQSQVPIYIVADGQNDTYTLPQIPAGTSSKYITINVGGTKYTPKADVAAGMPGDPKKNDNTAYINIKNRTVRLDPAPASGTVISGSMYYKYQPVYVQDDPALIQEQAAREGTDGIYEYAVSDPRMEGDDFALAQARTGYLLAKYGTPNLTGKLTSYVQGWRAGQFFYLNSTWRMGGISNQLMYVAKCDKTVVTHPQNGAPIFKYELTISDRPYIF
jgi:hypothetical protein